MKVVELSSILVRIPLKKAIKHASHTRTETDNLLVRCMLSDGTIGYGEGVPREYVTGETAESTLELLKKSDLASQFADCRDFPQALEMIERFRTAPVPNDDRECGGNAARCAVELALLDAYGRAFGEPLVSVTKLLAPDLYQFQPKIQYSGAITSAKGFKAKLAAWKMWVFGFKQLKLKVGIEGYDDAARLKSIRKRVGRKMDIRVDANEAWTPENVRDKISELEPFGISSVEQPVPHAQIQCMKEIRPQVKTPIMLDESLCSRVDAERAIDNGLCDFFNIRLSKCGGFIPSLRLAQLAKSRGLGYQLGCQVGETCLLSAAGRHFATSVKDIRYLEGSYDRHLVKEALGAEDITFQWAGWASALPGIGLGIDLNPAALARVAIKGEKLLGG
jgi:L-alanine-DL-glutamate epimerase-like enolase superfamily enzyme